MSSYATLAQSEADLKFDGLTLTAPTVVSGQVYIIEALEFVSARIDAICGQEFAPRIETRPYDATQRYIDWWRNQLILDRPILEPIEVKVADQTLTLWDGVYANKFSSDYTTYPIGMTPATALQGLTSWQAWYNNLLAGYGYAGLVGAISVRAIWGYRTRYDEEGWLASGGTVQNDPSLSASGTSLTIANPDLFSPGMLLRIGDEYLSVSAVNDNTSPTPDTLTVVRGVRGSTAVVHLKDAVIEIWYPEPNIVRACLRWSNYLYQRRAVYEAVTINANNTYASVFPQDVPEEVMSILQQYINIQSARV